MPVEPGTGTDAANDAGASTDAAERRGSARSRLRRTRSAGTSIKVPRPAAASKPEASPGNSGEARTLNVDNDDLGPSAFTPSQTCVRGGITQVSPEAHDRRA